MYKHRIEDLTENKIDMGDDFDEVIDEHRHPYKKLLKRSEACLDWTTKEIQEQYYEIGMEKNLFPPKLREAIKLLKELRKANDDK